MGFLDRLFDRRAEREPGGAFSFRGVGGDPLDPFPQFSLGLNPASSSLGLSDKFKIGIEDSAVDQGVAKIQEKKAKRADFKTALAAQLPNLVRMLTTDTSAGLDAALSDVAAANERAQNLIEERRERERDRAFTLHRDALGFNFEQQMEAGREKFQASESALGRGSAEGINLRNIGSQEKIAGMDIASREGEGDKNRAQERDQNSLERNLRMSITDKQERGANFRLGRSLEQQRAENFRQHLQNTAIPAAMGIQLGVTSPEAFRAAFEGAIARHEPYFEPLVEMTGRGLAAERLAQSGESETDTMGKKIGLILEGQKTENEFGINPRDENGDPIGWEARLQATNPDAYQWMRGVDAPQSTGPSTPGEAFANDASAQYRALAPEERAQRDIAVAALTPSEVEREATQLLQAGTPPAGVREMLRASVEQNAGALATVNRDLIERAIEQFEFRRTLELRTKTQSRENEASRMRFNLDLENSFSGNSAFLRPDRFVGGF